MKTRRNQRRLLTEFKILQRLDHPNVLKLIEVLEDESTFTLVVERFSGKTLLRIWKELYPRCFKEK